MSEDAKPMVGNFNVPTIKDGESAAIDPKYIIPLNGEVLPLEPGIIDQVDALCPLETGIKITVDILTLMQEGEETFFSNWSQKWADHKQKSPRSNWAIDGDGDNITASAPEKKE